MADTSVSNEEICLVAKNITKIYPGTKALDAVNFNVRRGKVNVLIGENGAGKSTLMKILAGIEKPTDGDVFLNGQKINFQNTRQALSAGIGIIHQELNLFPNLTVYQNIFMARESTRYKYIINDKEHRKNTKLILDKLRHPIDPNTPVGELRVGVQQIIEIAKTMSQQDLHVLIMDEPTSALSNAEVEVLFELIDELKEQGVAIVYISHRMDEIMKIGDYVTILRDGKLIAEAEVRDIDLPWIVKQMVGERGSEFVSYDRKIEDEILRVESLTLPRKGGGYSLHNVNFNVRRGEILGLYGLLGAGRTEVLECLMGIHKLWSGKFFLANKEIKIKSVHDQLKRGFALIPEDRKQEGLVEAMSIYQNLVLSSIGNYAKGFHLVKGQILENVNRMVKELFIKVSDTQLPIGSLSGGNQQKVVIGKGILTNPNILLLDEPTRGIDVNAKAEVFQLVRKFAGEGLGIIVVSSELKEIVDIADRVVVLSKGEVTGEFSGAAITEEALMSAASIGHNVVTVD